MIGELIFICEIDWSRPGPFGIPIGIAIFVVWVVAVLRQSNEKIAQDGREERAAREEERVAREKAAQQAQAQEERRQRVWESDKRELKERAAREAAKEAATSIHDAAFDGNIYLVKKRLAAGSDVNAKNSDGRTPLDMAIFMKKNDVIQLLRKYGGKTGAELR